ncbi:MAG: acetyl-CoA decarbonylase/synthase complex subunit delta [Chloroflexota bacterium]|nr:acetyl-CoA decarbonylase/synthase complex subunit delta [Chloroflexota bacterium]
MSAVQIPIEKWTGNIHQITLGGSGGRKAVTVGGESTLPFLKFEGEIPNKPAVAIEILDCAPDDWPPHLLSAWGDAVSDSAKWAKKAVEYGADIITLRLRSAHPEADDTGADQAKAVVDKVLSAVDIPLVILGPGVAEKDNEVLAAVSDTARGQRVALGNCEEKNYRTLAATCIADGHVAIGHTPLDINLAKQLNVLLSEVGFPIDSIMMDPDVGALGYGLEYSYSVMERLKLAALGGDGMAAMPMICNVGVESWRQKEAKSIEGMPDGWGDSERRALLWEEITAMAMLNAGANIVTLRHPKAVELVKATIDKLINGKM